MVEMGIFSGNVSKAVPSSQDRWNLALILPRGQAAALAVRFLVPEARDYDFLNTMAASSWSAHRPCL
jgi:hypothetical protein